MLSINIKDCSECGHIQELLNKVNKKIYNMGRDEYHHLIYLSSKNHTKAEMKRLVRYKNILNTLFWNSTYYERDLKTITSKIKSLL